MGGGARNKQDTFPLSVPAPTSTNTTSYLKKTHRHQQNATNLRRYLNALRFFSICRPTAPLKCCSKCSPPFIHEDTVHLRSAKFALDLVSTLQGGNQTQGRKEKGDITSMGSLGKKTGAVSSPERPQIRNGSAGEEVQQSKHLLTRVCSREESILQTLQAQGCVVRGATEYIRWSGQAGMGCAVQFGPCSKSQICDTERSSSPELKRRRVACPGSRDSSLSSAAEQIEEKY